MESIVSVEYYLVCHECRKRIHVAQVGLSGWTFYSGERDCMAKLCGWLSEHAFDLAQHSFVMGNEDETMSEDYPEIEWTPNHLSEPKDGR